jgi:crotonobetainyl-CoA:carnitine CoA-transferase CaiB-like acyl-CoA transferase
VGVAQGNIVPYQLFHCQDAPIIAGALNQRLWPRFCRAIDREDLVNDSRFHDNPSRTQNRIELTGLIENIMRTQRADRWIARFEQHEIPCGRVLSMREALELPQVALRGSIVETEGSNPIRLVGNPMRIEGHTPRYRVPAALGEHTSAIRREFLGSATMP